MKNISIKTKLSVAVALLVTVMTTVLSFTAYTHFEREFKDSVAKHHHALVKTVSTQLDNQVERSLGVLRLMAQGIPADQLHNAGAMQQILDQEKDARLYFDGGFLLLDGEGRIITESPQHPERRGKSHLHREYVRKTIETGKQVISSPYTASVPPFEPTITYTAPVFDTSGALKGVLAGRHLLLQDNYLSELSQVTLGDSGYLYLMDLDRRLIMHKDKKRVLEVVSTGKNIGIDRAISGFDGAVENVNSKGIKGITSFNHLKSAPWFVASHYPLSEAYAPLRNTRTLLILSSATICIISLFSVWILARRIASPLEKLTKHVRNLPEKGGDGRNITIITGDEFQTLAEAFNGMIAQIDLQEQAQCAQQVELATKHEELKSTHMQLLQQEKMASIGQLAAGVAHEINNPMGFISSNLGTLGKYIDRIKSFIDIQDEAANNLSKPDALSTVADVRKKLKIDFLLDDIPKLIAESIDGAERVKTIVQHLKSFSRVDQDEALPVDLNECLESTLTIAWNELKYKCTVEKEYGDLPRVTCFPQQLNQVFLNLLVNSAHAIEKQGVITVRTWLEGEMACVSIGDNGCGIPENIRTKIFEPFFTTKEVGKGTGLGLSISYDIIQRHNGTIEVESEAGTGTTFIIKLPVQGGAAQ